MSAHAKSAHRSKKIVALVLVYLAAKSAHRSLISDITVLPGILGFRRYGTMVKGHDLRSGYRYLTAWTESGLAAKVARRESAAQRVRDFRTTGNLDFRAAGHRATLV